MVVTGRRYDYEHGRGDIKMFNQDDEAGTPDFTAVSPTFSAGAITYSDANVSEGSQASYILGIAFEAAAAGGNPKGPFGMPLHGPFGGPI